MARIIEDQINLWAREHGIEAQRSDLWVVDFRLPLAGIKTVAAQASRDATEFPGTETLLLPNDILPTVNIATYFAKSIALPELKLRPDAVRRDSRPYQTPSWDEPLDAIRMSFMLDCFKDGRATSPYQSDIYNFLDFWRMVVRAGRGPMSNEYSIRLNSDYRIDYAYNVAVSLLRPGIPEIVNSQAQSNTFALDLNKSRAGQGGGGVQLPAINKDALNWATVQNDLQEALMLTLVNCWLGSFKVSDLSYDQGRAVQLDAVFYADNIQQKPISAG